MQERNWPLFSKSKVVILGFRLLPLSTFRFTLFFFSAVQRYRTSFKYYVYYLMPLLLNNTLYYYTEYLTLRVLISVLSVNWKPVLILKNKGAGDQYPDRLFRMKSMEKNVSSKECFGSISRKYPIH